MNNGFYNFRLVAGWKKCSIEWRGEIFNNLLFAPNGNLFPFKIDVFIVKNQPYDSQALTRCQPDTLDEESSRKFYLSSPEDIILNKLQWYQVGGGVSEQQWKDVLGVLKVQSDKLDLEYLRYWASRLNLTDLLNRSFNDAGLIEGI